MENKKKSKLSQKNQRIIDVAHAFGMGFYESEDINIKLRTDLSTKYLDEANNCFLNNYYIACTVLSCFSVESIFMIEIERELSLIKNSFVKENYSKFLSDMATFSSLIEEYKNLKICSPERISIITNYSRKLNQLRKKYVHCKIQKFLESGRKIKNGMSINTTKISLKDSQNSLIYAAKIIANVGIARNIIDKKRLLEKFNNEEIKNLINDVINILDKYDLDFYEKHGYSNKKLVVDDSLVRVLKYLFNRKINDNNIVIDSLKEDVVIIKNFFDKFSKNLHSNFI
jgi:hypothetical protein